jgi:hypothetical protein
MRRVITGSVFLLAALLLVWYVYAAAPVVDSLVVNSTNGYDTLYENLTAYATVSDADGNNVSVMYDWRLNGTSYAILSMNFDVNNSAGTGKTLDYTTYRNNGTISAAIWNATGGLNRTGGYRFDGSSSYINAGNSSVFNPSQITMTAWVYIASAPTNNGNVMGKGVNSGYRWRINNARSVTFFDRGATNSLTSLGAVPTGNWTFIAITGNASGLYIYLNGVLDNSNAVAYGAPNTVNDFLIGVQGSEYFNGYIDNPRVYARTLSPADIAALYQNRTDRIVNSTLSLGQNWSVCATPNDGTSDGTASCSSGLLIYSTLPRLTSFVVNSTYGLNKVTENITAYVSGLASSGNPVSFAYDWRVNGTSYAQAYYNFDVNNSGGTDKVKDYSTFSNNASLVTSTGNAPTWNATGGWNNTGGYEFYGNQSITVSNTSIANWRSAFTVMAWVKIRPTGGGDLFSKRSMDATSVTDFPFVTAVSASGVYVSLSQGDDFSWDTTISRPISTDVWTHVAVTYVAASNVTLYMNGVQVNSSALAYTISDNARNWTIGSLSYNTGYAYPGTNGSIDEFRLYNRSLSAAEIRAIYENKTNMVVTASLSVGQNWSACVTPNDGLNDGSMSCSSGLVVVSNWAPTITSLVMNSTAGSNSTLENLTAYATGSDLEGENISFTYDWRLHGVSIALVNMHFDVNNSAGAGKTRDYSRLGSNGTVSGAAWNRTAGWNGTGAYQFTTTNAINAIAVNTTSSKLGIGLWVRRSSNSTTANLVTSNDAVLIMDEGTTNIVINPSFETDVTGWDPTNGGIHACWLNNGATFTQYASSSVVGQYAAQSDGAGDYQGAFYTISGSWAAGTNFTLSLWVKTTASSQVALLDTTGSCDSIALISPETNGQWKRYTASGTIASSKTALYIVVRNLATGHDPIYIDGVQVEISNRSTSYADGSLGNGYSWGGTAHASNSTRNASLLIFGTTNKRASIPVSNWTLNSWHHVFGGYDNSSNISIYVDGVLQNTLSTTWTPKNQTGFTIGYDALWSHQSVNGTIDDLRIYNRSISSQQILALSQNRTDRIVAQELIVDQNWTVCATLNDGLNDGTTSCTAGLRVTDLAPNITSITLSSSAGLNHSTENLTAQAVSSDPEGEAVVLAYDWRVDGRSIAVINMNFDVNDSAGTGRTREYSSFGNNGTVIGAKWNANGRNGAGAYQFDGIDDYINLGNPSAVNISDKLTLAMWVNFSKKPTGAANACLLCKIESGGYGLLASGTTGMVSTYFHINGGYQLVNLSMGSINENAWYHLAATFNGSNISIYLDGVLRNSTTVSPGTISTIAYNLTIGANSGATYIEFFNGSIDDVRVFNRSLSSQQVLALYNNRSDLLVSQELTANQTWAVCATPNDGSSDGTTVCSNSVTLYAFGPRITSLVLNSTSAANRSDGNLTAHVVTFDSYGYNVSVAYDWRRNGTSIAALWYNFNVNNSGGTGKTQDFTSYGLNASVNGATWNATGGRNGTGAYYFDGIDDYLTVNGVNISNQSFTVVLWTYRMSNTTNDALFAVGEPNGDNGYLFMLSNDTEYGVNVVNGKWNSTLGGIGSPGLSQTGNWTQWAIVNYRQGDTGNEHGIYSAFVQYSYLYRNGVLLGGNFHPELGSFTGSGSMSIGHARHPRTGSWAYETWNNDTFFHGYIDEMRVYNRALGPDQMRALYQNDAVLTSAELDHGNTNFGVCVTPDDTNLSGPMVCSNINIAEYNNPPALTSIVLNTTYGLNRTGENLTVHVNASDPDGDYVYSSKNWLSNGTSVMVLYTTFDVNNSGGLSATRNYANGSANGTISANGGVIWVRTGGFDGGGYMTWDGRGGSNDTITLNYDNTKYNTTFTYSFWAYPNQTRTSTSEATSGVSGGSGQRYAIAPTHGNSDAGVGVSVGTNGISVFEHGSGYLPSTLVWPGSVSGWTHVVVVVKNRIAYLYVNGQFVHRGLQSGRTSLTSKDLGDVSGSDYGPYSGKLDDVRIYTRALTEREIAALYAESSYSGYDLIQPVRLYPGNANWSVCVASNDGYNETNTICATNVSFPASTTPSVSSITLNASVISPSSDVPSTLIASNPDNVSFTTLYDWRVNGSQIAYIALPFNTNASSPSNYGGSGFSFSVTGGIPDWQPDIGPDGSGAYRLYTPKEDGFNTASAVALNNRSFSLMTWARRDGTTAGYLMGQGGSVTNMRLYFGFSSATAFICGFHNNDLSVTIAPDNAWHHWTCTYDSVTNNRTIYMDGLQIASAIASNDYGADPGGFHIGYNGVSYNSYFNGTIDDVRVYQRALSPEYVYRIATFNESVLPEEETSRGDRWRVCTTVFDDYAASSTSCSPESTMTDNIPPTMNATMNSTLGWNTTAENLTAYVSSYDADGNNITFAYDWRVNGTSITTLNMPFDSFDSGSSGKTRDYSSYSRNTTSTGATWNATGGWNGTGAYQFDGVDDTINTGIALSNFITNTAGTMMLWVKPTGPSPVKSPASSGQNIILDSNGADNGAWVAISRSTISGADCIWTVNYDGNEDNGCIPYTNDQWVHIAWVHSGGVLYGYKNGVLVNWTTSGTTTTMTNPLYLSHPWGNNAGSQGLYFNGSIDDVRVFNRSLSAAEILAIANNQSHIMVSNELSAGQNWTVCVTPNDGQNDGATNCTAGLLVSGVPNTTAASITPANPNVSSTLTGSCTGTQGLPGLLAYNYQWYKDGVLNASGFANNSGNFYTSGQSVSVASVSAGLARGQSWILSCMATDYANNASWLNSTAVTINNTPPILSSLVMNSTLGANSTYEDLTAYTALTDVDSDNRSVAYDWRLNGTSFAIINFNFDVNNSGGTGKTRDYSMFGNNGTVNGATWNATGGRNGTGAYNFTGANNITITAVNLSNRSFTLEAWVRRSSAGTNDYIFGGGSAASNLGLHFGFLSTDVIRFGFYSNDLDTVATYADTGWHHVVGTYNQASKNKTIYVDGVQVASAIATADYGSNLTTLGGASWSGTGMFGGYMDEVRIYNRSLSAAQILALYQNRSDMIMKNELVIGQNWSVCATPNDGTNDGSTGCTGNLTIIPLNISYTYLANISPSNPTPQSALLGWCNGTGAPFTSVSYFYRWYRNGTLNTSGYATNGGSNYTNEQLLNIVNLSANFVHGQQWSFSCLATNGVMNGSWVDSSNVTIIGLSLSMTATPNPVSVGSAYSVSGQFSYQNGTPIDNAVINVYRNGTILTDMLYGDGSDGTLALTSGNTIINNYTHIMNTTIAAGSMSFGVNSTAEFSVGNMILIIQMQNGTNGIAGTNEYTVISSISGNTITVQNALQNTYYSGTFNTSGATSTQIVSVPQYTLVNLTGTAIVSARAWNGYSGGILVMKSTGAIIVGSGTQLNATGAGFRGGRTPSVAYATGQQGESHGGLGGGPEPAIGTNNVTLFNASFGGGGGGGSDDDAGDNVGGGGGGGSYGTQGTVCTYTTYNTHCGNAGNITGIANLSTVLLGSGGGGGGVEDGAASAGAGGAGGGAIILFANNISNAGTVKTGGQNGYACSGGEDGSGGAGSGGSIYLVAPALTLGTTNAAGGTGPDSCYGQPANKGGNGGNGRIRLDFTTVSGSSTPGAGYNGTIGAQGSCMTNGTGYYNCTFAASSTIVTYNISVNATASNIVAGNSTILTTYLLSTNNASIAPNPAYNSSTLLGYCEGTTASTVSYHYQWFRNGTLNASGYATNGGAGYTSGLLVNVANVSSGLVIGQTWILSCLATDGSSNASWYNSSTTTIINPPPTITSLIVNSTRGYNTTIDNLTAYPSATDPDGEAVRYVYDWRVNGTSIAVLNMNFGTNNSAGTNRTRDYSRSGNNGTVNGSIWNATGGWNGTGAYRFTRDESIVASTASNYPSGKLSVEMWVQRASSINRTENLLTSNDTVFLIDEGTTNMMKNPSFETDSVGWNATTNAFLDCWLNDNVPYDRNSSDAVVGQYSLRIAPTGNYMGVFYNLTGSFSSGATYTVSFWARGTNQSQAALVETNGCGNIGIVTMDTSNEWKRYNVTGTLTGARTELYLVVRNTAGGNDPFFIDGVQWERRGNATSYADGSLGNGYAWVGTAHASNSTRQPNLLIFGTASKRASLNVSNWTTNSWHHVVGVYDNSSNITLYVDGVLRDNLTTTWTPKNQSSFDIGYSRTWYHSALNGTIDEVRVYNRSLTAAQIAALYQNRTDRIVGSELSPGQNWTACVTPNDGTSDGATNCTTGLLINGNIAPSITSLVMNSTRGTNTTNENLTAYASSLDMNDDAVRYAYDWRVNGTSIALVNMNFDVNDSAGTNKTRDYSMYGNNGTVVNLTWNATGGWNGTGAYMFTNRDNASIVVENSLLTGNMTVSAWVYPGAAPNVDGRIVASTYEWNGATNQKGWNLGVTYGSTDVFGFTVFDNANTAYSVDYSGFWSSYSGKWTHVTGVFTAGQNLSLYIDGVLVNSTASVPAAISYDSTPANISIGARADYPNAANWDGRIDAFLLFNRSLTPQQVLALYQNRTDVIVSQELALGQNWTVCATPNDGQNDGARNCTSGLQVILPSILTYNASILPSTAYASSTLLGYCNGTATATVSYHYQWFRDGVGNASGYATNGGANYTPGSLVNVANVSAGLAKNQGWILSCLATGEGYNGSWVNSSTLTINNSIPVISSLVMNSTRGTNTTDENLTAYPTASDIDNDAIRFAYDWRVNGTSIAVVNMNFDTFVDATYLIGNNDFETGSVGSCPTGWICTGDAELASSSDGQGCVIAGNINGTSYAKAGCDATTGTMTSANFTLPARVGSILFRRAGGANSPSGFYVKRASDGVTLCSSTNGTDSDTFFEDSCDGLSAYEGTLAYIYLDDQDTGGWGKVYIDNIRMLLGPKDYSSFSNDGAVTGATWNATGGWNGTGAYVFNGENSKIAFSNISIPRTNGTFSLWWRPDEAIGAVAHPLFRATITGGFFDIYPYSDGKLYAGWYNNGEDDRIQWTMAGITQGSWHHVVVSWADGGYTSLYIDGVYKANTSGLNATFDTVPGVADLMRDGTSFSKGAIDNVIIYNKTLSPQQIAALYQNRSDRIVSQELQLAQNWSVCATPNDGTVDGSTSCTTGLNITVLPDTCTPPGVNNDWNVNAADFCTITGQSVNLGTGTLTVSGIGYLRLTSGTNITAARASIGNGTGQTQVIIDSLSRLSQTG